MIRNQKLYLQDILDSISKIEKYTRNLKFDKFARDQKTIDATVRNLTIIGEAVRNLSKEFKTKHSEIPWSQMISMRNIVIHEYFGVEEEILWKTIKEDLLPPQKIY